MSGHMTVNYIVVTIGQFLEKGKWVTPDDSSPVPKHRRTSRPNSNNGSSQSDSSMYAGHTGHTHRSSHSHLDTKTHRSNSPPQVVDTSPHIHSNRTVRDKVALRKGKLCDRQRHAANKLLAAQFPHLQGLQSTLLSQTSFTSIQESGGYISEGKCFIVLICAVNVL